MEKQHIDDAKTWWVFTIIDPFWWCLEPWDIALFTSKTYPPGMKQWLSGKSTIWLMIFPSKLLFIKDLPLPRLITEGYSVVLDSWCWPIPNQATNRKHRGTADTKTLGYTIAIYCWWDDGHFFLCNMRFFEWIDPNPRFWPPYGLSFLRPAPWCSARSRRDSTVDSRINLWCIQ